MTKQPKDKIITYWSGKKLRYRKDGEPDMRYTLGRREAKKATPKRMPLRHEFSLWGAIKIGLVFGALVALIMVLQAILDRPNRGEFLSPLSHVAVAKEVAPTIVKDFCKMDEVSEQICMYEWDARKALAIAMAENGYLERRDWWIDAQNINSNMTGDFGIMQVNSVHGYPLARLVTIEGNIMFAHRVYANREQWDTDGFNAWVVYKTDRYYQALELIKEYE